MDNPRRQADDEERDRETGLFSVELAWPVELVEHKGQAGETAGWRPHRDLGADTQKVRDREDDHVDRDERDQVEVRALHCRKRPVGCVHRQIIAHPRYRWASESTRSGRGRASVDGAAAYAVYIRARLLAA